MNRVTLETRGLTKSFGGLIAIKSLDVVCDSGDILGIIGPNGAGKTTLFNLISGVYPPTKGVILFQGMRIEGKKMFERASLGIGRTFQVTRPFKELTCLENIMVPYAHAIYQRYTDLFRNYNQKEVMEHCLTLLEYVGLKDYAHIQAKHLPLGMQRRLEVGRALALAPSLLLLDEPFSGLSFEESYALERLLRDIKAEGKTIMLIEHNMDIAMNLCDKLVVLHQGRKIAEGRPEEVKSHPDVISAYLGE
jgi:branched-chain amino acid transport system ATP-binding protein